MTSGNPNGMGVSSQMNSGTTTALENPLAAFFGPAPRDTQQNARRGQWNRNKDMYAAYEGESEYMSDLMEGLIASTGAFLVNRVLPAQASPQMHWKWKTWRFDRRYAEQVPHEAAPRLIKYAETSHEAHTVRRGQMIYLEADFMRTPEGIEKYAQQLMQMRNNVDITNQHDVLYTLMHCHDDMTYWNQQYATKMANVHRRADFDINEFAKVVRAPKGRGIYLLDNDIREIAGILNVTFDTYILRAGIGKWVQTIPQGTTLYMYAGQEGVDRLFRGTGVLGSIRDVPVFEAPPFDALGLEDGGLTPTDEIVQTGEYNVMLNVDPVEGKYSSEWRAHYQYNEDEDRDVKITLLDALANSMAWEDNEEKTQFAVFGKMANGNYPNSFSNLVTMKMVSETDIEKMVESSNKNLTEAEILATDLSFKSLAELVRGNVYLPFQFLLFKPWITHIMSAILAVKSGSETGNLFYGHSNFVIGHDATIKVLVANYTYYSKAVVHDPKNVIIKRNQWYVSYEGGDGAGFITPEDIERWSDQYWQLNTPEDMQEGRASILSVLVPNSVSDARDLKKVMDITGQFYEDAAQHTQKYLYPTYSYYVKKWRLEDQQRRIRGTIHQPRVEGLNTLVCRAYQRNYNIKEGKFNVITVNQGHHGEHVGTGCGRIRKGQDFEYPEFTYVKQVSDGF